MRAGRPSWVSHRLTKSTTPRRRGIPDPDLSRMPMNRHKLGFRLRSACPAYARRVPLTFKSYFTHIFNRKKNKSMNKQFLYFTFGSYKKKVQNTRRNRVFSAKLGFLRFIGVLGTGFARFLNMSVTFFLLMYLILPLTATAQIVNIPDLNLRAAVETALGKVSGATITTDEMATLVRLDASDAGIHDLNGLEAATNLTRVNLDNNSIADISALGDLTQLHGAGALE